MNTFAEIHYNLKTKNSVQLMGSTLVTFNLNTDKVYCSFNENAPNLSVGRIAVFKLPLGEYTFSFRKDGYKEYSSTSKISADIRYDIELTQDRTQRIAYKPPAVVIATSNPSNAEIILNGQKKGFTDNTLTGIVPGKHEFDQPPMFGRLLKLGLFDLICI